MPQVYLYDRGITPNVDEDKQGPPKGPSRGHDIALAQNTKMDGRTDNRTHSMTTYFLKAPHQQKPEPLSLQLAYLQWKLHNTWVHMYYINPNAGLPHVLRSRPRSTPNKRGRKHGSHSFGQSPRYRVAEIKSVKVFL
eukprot:scaffold115_cov172-Amphora_coffeaeformis.AAC.15